MDFKSYDYIFVKKIPSVLSKDDFFTKMMVFLKDDEWKITRSLMSSTFTSGKLKTVIIIFIIDIRRQ
jgi:hypothetical protein